MTTTSQNRKLSRDINFIKIHLSSSIINHPFHIALVQSLLNILLRKMPLEHQDQTQPKYKSNGSTLALGIIGTSFVGTLALISPFILMQLRSPLPYMATPRRKVLAALEEISSRKGLIHRASSSSATMSKPKSTSIKQVQVPLRYYDLGSGDGETILAAASVGWRATGIELNSTLWGISSIRRLFSPSYIRSKSNFIWGDLWKENLSDADAVMIFGVKPLMAPIAKKIEAECGSGTYLMSYRFHVPLQSKDEPSKNNTSEKGALRADLVYDEEEMRIYELR